MEEKTLETISFLINRIDNIRKLEMELLNNPDDKNAGIFMPRLVGFEFDNGSTFLPSFLGETDLESFSAEIGQTIKTWCERAEELTKAELLRFIKETPDPICN